MTVSVCSACVDITDNMKMMIPVEEQSKLPYCGITVVGSGYCDFKKSLMIPCICQDQAMKLLLGDLGSTIALWSKEV